MLDSSFIDNGAQQMKDMLLNDLNEVNENAMGSDEINVELAKAERLIHVLERTRPLWFAIRYSYKGREILYSLQGKMRNIEYNVTSRAHVLSARYNQMWLHLNTLLSEYYADEQKWLHSNELSPEDAYWAA